MGNYQRLNKGRRTGPGTFWSTESLFIRLYRSTTLFYKDSRKSGFWYWQGDWVALWANDVHSKSKHVGCILEQPIKSRFSQAHSLLLIFLCIFPMLTWIRTSFNNFEQKNLAYFEEKISSQNFDAAVLTKFLFAVWQLFSPTPRLVRQPILDILTHLSFKNQGRKLKEWNKTWLIRAQ